ncbi:hypothetical protein C2G38_2084034 [Gigaspora rosea]|uniref:Uncharacterized protein n=1 Tax=Gigaspora rosea TaxID=44941 RepID=A0A397VAV9_9GLOM|nr:hypothetical protein C2G38_2084034 [Gigaspora rosea]
MSLILCSIVIILGLLSRLYINMDFKKAPVTSSPIPAFYPPPPVHYGENIEEYSERDSATRYSSDTINDTAKFRKDWGM